MKRLFFFLKILLSIVILGIIFAKIDFSQFLAVVGDISILTIIFISLLGAVKLIFQIINWKMYLQINIKYKPNISEIISSHFIGHSLRFLLPGGHAVIGKMYFVDNRKRDSFLSIGIEKFFQMWRNLVFAVIAFIYFYRPMQNLQLQIFITIAVISLPAIILLLNVLIKRESYLNYLKQYNRYLIPIIFNMIIHHLLTFVQYHLILRTFSDFSLLKSSVASSLIMFANLIPITYSGLGLRETFGIEVLQNYDIGASAAVATTLLSFIINSVLPALVGVYFILKRSKERKK